MDKAAQAADSIDFPGGIWTELWAPVGLRYHATHHCYPGIPYHALQAAYRRLTQALPDYGKMTRPGLLRTLRRAVSQGAQGLVGVARARAARPVLKRRHGPVAQQDRAAVS